MEEKIRKKARSELWVEMAHIISMTEVPAAASINKVNVLSIDSPLYPRFLNYIINEQKSHLHFRKAERWNSYLNLRREAVNKTKRTPQCEVRDLKTDTILWR